VIHITGTFKIIRKLRWKWNTCSSLLFIL